MYAFFDHGSTRPYTHTGSLSNDDIFDDLHGPFLKSNISKNGGSYGQHYYSRLIGNDMVPNISNGTMFGDLD